MGNRSHDWSLARLLALVVVTCVAVGCANEIDPDLNGVGQPIEFTAEDWFRGLVFADGPVAQRVPTIRDNFLISDRVEDPKVLAAVRQKMDELILAIDRLHPGKLEELKTEFTSRDHPRILQALIHASQLGQEVIEASGLTTETVQTDNGLCIAVTVIFVITEVIHEAVAVTVNVAVAVNVAIETSVAINTAVTAQNLAQDPPEGDFPRDVDGNMNAVTSTTGSVVDEVAREECLRNTTDASGEECSGPLVF